MDVLDFVRQSSAFSSNEVRSLLNNAIIHWAGESSERQKSEYLDSLLTWGADPEVLFTVRWKFHTEKSNTLLHCISTLRDFDLLVTNGFKSFNHANSSGTHPLMKLVEWNDSQLLRKCIESGSHVNHQDHLGRTSLHVSAEEIWESFLSINYNNWDSRFQMFECAEELLCHGSDPFLGDKCCCACSTLGCTPINVLLKEHRKLWETPYLCLPRCQYFLCLEWFDLIRKIKGVECAKRCLLDMIRVIRFEELGLTHTCCRKVDSEPKGLWMSLDDEEVDEILDEEKELIFDFDSQMFEIEKDIQSGSDLDAIFLSEIVKLIQIRNERQRGLFLASQANLKTAVSTADEPTYDFYLLT
jgi:hypothetical protein